MDGRLIAFAPACDKTPYFITDSVTTIGDYAFSYCTELIDVAIPNSVTSIGSHAFSHCSWLTSIAIPDSVTSIGDYAFYWCHSLKVVWCWPTTPPSGGSYMFDGNASGRKIFVPGASVSAYRSASHWSAYADAIVR